MLPLTNLYRYLPLGLRGGPPRRLPTILFLHGALERGEDMGRLLSIGLPRLCRSFEESGRDFNFPFQVIAPQLAERKRWHWKETLRQFVGFLDELEADPWTDPESFYLAGFSMGGDGVWALAARHPHRFAAIVPVSGQNHDLDHIELLDWLLPTLKTLPCWIAWATHDEYVPGGFSATMAELLAGGRETVARCFPETEAPGYPNVHVMVCEKTFTDPGLYNWLLEHRKPRMRGPSQA